MGIVESTKISLILLGKGILLLEGIMLFIMMIGTKLSKKIRVGDYIMQVSLKLSIYLVKQLMTRSIE